VLALPKTTALNLERGLHKKLKEMEKAHR